MVLLSGCAMMKSKPHVDPFAATWPEEMPVVAVANGAIYQSGHDMALFENSIARRVGDTVTINLQESTAAQKSSSTKTSKNSKIDLPGPTLGGGAVKINGREILGVGIDNSRDFDGSGDSSLSNKLQGNITVTVAKQLANGNLLVRGQKWIGINQGSEFIRIQGVIRPVDILPDNTIPSYKGCGRVDFLWRAGRAGRCQPSGPAVPLLQLTLEPVLMNTNIANRLGSLALAALCAAAPLAQADSPVRTERVKDLATVSGVRGNQLVGYGLVVGLDGTGDQTSQAPFTIQSIKNMLSKFGVTIPPNANPQLKNVAAVTVTADLPSFAKQGQTIDVTVASIGNAASLRGGTLMMTPLRGIDGEVYAIAQGSMLVSGFGVKGDDGSKLSVNVPSSGRVPNGATVEKEVANNFAAQPFVMLNLHTPDFTTASRLAGGLNELLGPDAAQAIDSVSVKVKAPLDPNQRTAYLSTLENVEIEPGDAPARVIVNSHTGTVVIGSRVRVSRAAVAHGSLSVTITERQDVSQPAPFSKGETVVTPRSEISVNQDGGRMFLFESGVNLDEIVRAVNQVGAAPGDLVAILEALKEAGALRAELIVI